jgi:hypothetical protein
MSKKKKSVVANLDVVVEKVAPEPKKSPVVSCVCPDAWWSEVGSVMEGRFSEDFIVQKAKEAFGYMFEDDRFSDITSSLETRVKNVWESQK